MKQMRSELRAEIKKLINLIGFDLDGKEWEYDSTYVTREEVTDMLLQDIEEAMTKLPTKGRKEKPMKKKNPISTHEVPYEEYRKKVVANCYCACHDLGKRGHDGLCCEFPNVLKEGGVINADERKPSKQGVVNLHDDSPTPTKQEGWEKKFDDKWSRIQKTMTGHISGREIWDVSSGADEDSYVYVDETLKDFIRQTLSSEKANWVQQGRDEQWKIDLELFKRNQPK